MPKERPRIRAFCLFAFLLADAGFFATSLRGPLRGCPHCGVLGGAALTAHPGPGALLRAVLPAAPGRPPRFGISTGEHHAPGFKARTNESRAPAASLLFVPFLWTHKEKGLEKGCAAAIRKQQRELQKR